MKIIGGFEDVGEMAREAGQAVAKQAKNGAIDLLNLIKSK